MILFGTCQLTWIDKYGYMQRLFQDSEGVRDLFTEGAA